MKKILILLVFSLTLTSCKKGVNEPIDKSLNVVDSLSIVGYISKDSTIHKFNVNYLTNISIDTLILEDNVGNSTFLYKINDTIFESSNFLGVEGRLYTLKLKYNSNFYIDTALLDFANASNNFLPKANLKIEI